MRRSEENGRALARPSVFSLVAPLLVRMLAAPGIVH